MPNIGTRVTFRFVSALTGVDGEIRLGCLVLHRWPRADFVPTTKGELFPRRELGAG